MSQGEPLLSDALLGASSERSTQTEILKAYKSIHENGDLKKVSTETLMTMAQNALRWGHRKLYCKIKQKLLNSWQDNDPYSPRIVRWTDFMSLLKDGIRTNSYDSPRCHNSEISLKLLEYTEQNPRAMMRVVSELSLYFLRQNNRTLMERSARLIPKVYPGRRGPSHDNYTSQLALRSAVVGGFTIARTIAKRIRSRSYRKLVVRTVRYFSQRAQENPKAPGRVIRPIVIRTYLAQENTEALTELSGSIDCKGQLATDLVYGLRKLGDARELVNRLQRCNTNNTLRDQLEIALKAHSVSTLSIDKMTLNQKVDVIEFILRQNYHHSLDQKARIVLQLAASIPAKETNALTNLLELAKAYGARDLYCQTASQFPAGTVSNAALTVALAGCGKIEEALKKVANDSSQHKANLYVEMAHAIALANIDKPLSSYPQTTVQDILKNR
ncbi:MAG TPA: hypothetical protein EYN06_09245 [Myxococcales bacterium]|nr:hypothetical protein [Myxococcales bacterium]HIN86653.1 hypothetical protein [Myxococcales bacterium]